MVVGRWWWFLTWRLVIFSGRIRGYSSLMCSVFYFNGNLTMSSLKNSMVIAVFGATLALAGCKTTQPEKTTASSAAQNAVKQINYLTMSFPQQVQWVQSQNKGFENGNMVAAWIAKGYNDNNTPVKVIYNTVAQTANLTAFLQGALKPLQTSCADLKITNLKPVNSHSQQINLEVICSRLGKNNFGVLYYITALADGKNIHMVRSETKTLPSAKAGILNPRNQNERNMVNNSAALINLMNGFRQTIKACDAQNHCW